MVQQNSYDFYNTNDSENISKISDILTRMDDLASNVWYADDYIPETISNYGFKELQILRLGEYMCYNIYDAITNLKLFIIKKGYYITIWDEINKKVYNVKKGE